MINNDTENHKFTPDLKKQPQSLVCNTNPCHDKQRKVDVSFANHTRVPETVSLGFTIHVLKSHQSPLSL